MPTKAQLESERDALVNKLEDAYAIIGEALGYDDDADDPEEKEDDEEESDG